MKPTVRKWIKCLKVILPLFIDKVEVNAFVDDLRKLSDELKIEPIEYLYLLNKTHTISTIRLQKLDFLTNFKELRWPKLIRLTKRMIATNNDIGFGNTKFGDYRNYETFFFRILNNVMCYFDKNDDVPDAIVQKIRDKVNMYLHLCTRQDLKNVLETARDDFRNDIPELNDLIEMAANKYSNEKLRVEFDDVLHTVDELIAKKEIFKTKWNTMVTALEKYGAIVWKKLDLKANVAKLMLEYFGDVE